MSRFAEPSPKCIVKEGAIALVIEPRERDLGGFVVRRVLPSSRRRMVGRFIFSDQMGTTKFAPRGAKRPTQSACCVNRC